MSRLTFCIVVLLAASCASDEPVETPRPDEVSAPSAAFTPIESDPAWMVGDACEFLVHTEDDGETETWRVRLELLEQRQERGLTSARYTSPDGASTEFPSETLEVTVTIRDDAGSEETSRSVIGEQFLRADLTRYGDALLRRSEIGAARVTASAEERREVMFGLLTLIAMANAIQENPAASPLLWRVVDLPSVASIVRSAGVDVGIKEGQEPPRRVVHSLPDPIGDVPGHHLPMALDVNGETALLLDLEVCPPAPPLMLCGGILAFVGRHPDDPDRSARVELVSATRGAGPRIETIDFRSLRVTR